MYLIDRPEPSKTLVKARQIAGSQIENLLEINHKPNEPMAYRWIKTIRTYPSLEHFTFAYKNALFPVFVELIEDGISMMTTIEKERFIDAAKRYNLIPCVFKVNVKRDSSSPFKNVFGGKTNDDEIIMPVSDGWNLYDLRNGDKIVPENFGTDEEVPMSEWEIMDFAIQICRDEIEKRGWKLLSYCSLPEIEPQIWIKDEFGKVGWIVVKPITKKHDKDKDYKSLIKKRINLSCIKKYKGYFSKVDLSADDSFPDVEPALNRYASLSVNFLGFESL